MAERRMFAKSIVLSDAFLSMPASTQVLYFHLGLSARNKGRLNNVRSIAMVCGASPSDIQTLIDKGYLIKDGDEYEIVHWYENNGIGETAKKRNNYRYRQWRQGIINRDKVCRICGAASSLEVHHIKHFSEYPELRLSDDNAVVLCKECHRELHRREKNGKKKNV